jgi:hypothetical protein
MTEDNLTQHLGQKRWITTTVGSNAFHFRGLIKFISTDRIVIIDEKEGEVEVPRANTIIRELP